MDEYADGLHFLASFCYYSKAKSTFILPKQKLIVNKKEISIEFLQLFKLASEINVKKLSKVSIAKFMHEYLKFALKLGMTSEDIIDAYYKKHEVNYERQKTNY
jgi:dimeric dUTPase (all-alpha-NTP-PPase superfamily)